MATRTIFKCPHCREELDRDTRYQLGLSSAASGIGERIIVKCKHCGKPVSNGKKEWLDMNTREKCIAVTGCVVISIMGSLSAGTYVSLFFVVLFAIFHIEYPQIPLPVELVIGIICSLLTLSLCAKGYKREINESIMRSKKAQKKNVILPFPKYAQTDDDIKVIQNNMGIVNGKISEISLKNKKLSDNNDLLKNNIANKRIADMITKNEKVILYLNSLYDKYVGLNIELYFSALTFYLRKEDIKNIEIKEKIDGLTRNIVDYIYLFLPRDKSLNQIIDVFKISGSVIKEIFESINRLKLGLITLQNKIIISNISPVEVERYFNSIMLEKDYDRVSININDLNNEYDRFFSEYDVTDGLK